MIKTLEEANERIRILEAENKKLKKQVEKLRKDNEKLLARKAGGRRRHDETWMASFNDFVIKTESGMTIAEIVKEGKISRRTAYRYLAYYKELQERN